MTQPTASSSKPVGVPTAVDAGLASTGANEDSHTGAPILGAGLLAVGGLMIGSGAFLALRRRGMHSA